MKNDWKPEERYLKPICELKAKYEDLAKIEKEALDILPRGEADAAIAMLNVIHRLRDHRAENDDNAQRLERLRYWLELVRKELVERKNYEAADMIRTILEKDQKRY